jgi:hypothetical protein
MACGTLALTLCVPSANALTRYELRAVGAAADTLHLVFALTCSDSSNALMILDAGHDGWREIATTGGPVMGDLLTSSNPAATTRMVGGAFYDDIDLRLVGFTGFQCRLEPTEVPPPEGLPTSQVALYLMDDAGAVIPTTDPIGADVLAALDISGSAGGELSVFYPLAFVPPDTLFLDLDAPLVEVDTSPPSGRLRLLSVAPNPTVGIVKVTFELPSAGPVRMQVFDVQGRLVAEPLEGVRAAGRNSVAWDMRDRSRRRVAAGLYIVEVRFGRQSVVRKFIVLS